MEAYIVFFFLTRWHTSLTALEKGCMLLRRYSELRLLFFPTQAAQLFNGSHSVSSGGQRSMCWSVFLCHNALPAGCSADLSARRTDNLRIKSRCTCAFFFVPGGMRGYVAWRDHNPGWRVGHGLTFTCQTEESDSPKVASIICNIILHCLVRKSIGLGYKRT